MTVEVEELSEPCAAGASGGSAPAPNPPANPAPAPAPNPAPDPPVGVDNCCGDSCNNASASWRYDCAEATVPGEWRTRGLWVCYRGKWV